MPELKFFPESHVAFVSEIGPYKTSIPRAFKRLFDWLETNGVQPRGPLLAILYDDPSKVAPQNQRVDACAPIGPQDVGSDQVRTKEIGGWKVATTMYDGDKNLPRALREVHDWLRDQGFAAADVPVVKYLSSLGDTVRAEVGVPVIQRERMPAPRKVQARAKRPAARKTVKRAARKAAAKDKTARSASS